MREGRANVARAGRARLESAPMRSGNATSTRAARRAHASREKRGGPKGHSWRALALLGAALAAQACVPVRYALDENAPDAFHAAHAQREQALTGHILALGPGVDPAEAAAVAQLALTYPLELASSYRLTKPPITHNMLVNIGLKPRGLCVHWTEDLLRKLAELELRTLDLYWGVAYPTSPFRLEHSTPVVTARGQAFEHGILLDAWRNSGELFFAPVSDDTRYAWQQLHNPITDYPPVPDG